MIKFVPEPQVRELLQQQGQAIESMTRLLNALLDISRLESGAIEPVSAEVSVGRGVRGAALGVRFGGRVHAEIDLQVEAPRIVLVDGSHAVLSSCCRTWSATRSSTPTTAGCGVSCIDRRATA